MDVLPIGILRNLNYILLSVIVIPFDVSVITFPEIVKVDTLFCTVIVPLPLLYVYVPLWLRPSSFVVT